MLTGGRRPIMAAGTVGVHIRVIEIRGYPAGGVVADHTVFRGRHMVRGFTDCRGAVMTTAAGADHIRVIHPDHRYPSGVAMAILAHIVGGYMGRMFAGGSGAVMTARTVCRGAGMIEIGRHPGVGGVTGLTVIPAGDMCGMFACSGGAIVTAGTRTLYLSMVDPDHRNPAGVAMAALANISGLDMRRVLASGRSTVMTG